MELVACSAVAGTLLFAGLTSSEFGAAGALSRAPVLASPLYRYCKCCSAA